MLQNKILMMILVMLGANMFLATTNLTNASVFAQTDTDGDGVEDSRDNCPATYNPEKIAFVSGRDGNSEIYVMNADGSNPVRLTNNQANDLGPSFSPDGSKIVFYSNRDGNYEIYVMNPDGSEQTRLTDNSAGDYVPKFSPDGSRIVFHSNRDNNENIFVMNSDGTNQTRLTATVSIDSQPEFSPDGSKIVFNSNRDGGFEVYIMNADGTNPVSLTNNDRTDSAPSFSPDGSKIVFHSVHSNGAEIYVMNSNGTNQGRLTDNSAIDSNGSFSPDGSKIVFTSDRTGDLEIFVMDADGTNVLNLSNNAANEGGGAWGRQTDSDGDGTGDACENTAPTINAAASVSLAQNSALPSQQIATVSDNESLAENLTVSIVGTLPYGVSVENISIDSNGEVTAEIAASCSASLGASTLTLQVSDGELTTTAELTVNVTPSNPAVIALKPFTVVSVPNHRLQTFTVSQMIESATDDCGGDVSAGVTIEKAAADEAVDIPESGNTEPDIIIGADCRSVLLRAERSGTGNGRVYTITLKVTDSSGNTTRADYKVFVPRGSEPAAEDPAAYTVDGGCL